MSGEVRVFLPSRLVRSQTRRLGLGGARGMGEAAEEAEGGGGGLAGWEGAVGGRAGGAAGAAGAGGRGAAAEGDRLVQAVAGEEVGAGAEVGAGPGAGDGVAPSKRRGLFGKPAPPGHGESWSNLVRGTESFIICAHSCSSSPHANTLLGGC
jgi:hypothetical protein